MKEKEFLRQISSFEMPDIPAVREDCIDQLKQGKTNQKIRGGHKMRGLVGAGMVAAVILCLCVIPGNSLTGKAIRQWKTHFSFQEGEKSLDIAAQENNGEASDSSAVQEHGIVASENDEVLKSIEGESDSGNESDSGMAPKGKQGGDQSLYWDVEGGSISMDRGETIQISAEDQNKYEDVYIVLLGSDLVETVGNLKMGQAYEFTADQAGQYVIYAGNKNITEEVSIGHEKSVNEDPLLFLKKSSYKEYAKKNVTMELVSVSKKKIKIKFTNIGTEEFQYSKIFTLKKWKKGKWKKVPFGRKAMFPKCVFPLDSGSSQMETITWRKFFDKDLPQGRYKIQWAHNSINFGL